MQNKEFNQKQKDQPKSPELSDNMEYYDEMSNKSSSNNENQSDRYDIMKQQLEELRKKLDSTQSEANQRIYELEIELKQKYNEIIKYKAEYDTLKTSIQDKMDQNEDLKKQIIIQKEKNQQLEAELENSNSGIEQYSKLIKEARIEKESFLSQIAKLQDLIDKTENEIEEIEAGHVEIQDQLRLEIKRLEERTGQMSADLSRETTGTLARDRHIRSVLNESEIGRVLLYIVDYFDNPKKNVLALDILCSELNITPIIARRNLRHLHELGVCKFNEVSREIKIIK